MQILKLFFTFIAVFKSLKDESMEKTALDSHSKSLFQSIQKKINKNLSLIEVIAQALNINYDAAYRRINGKVKLSLEEAVILSHEFNLSLTELFCLKEDNSYWVKETNSISTVHDFGNYLQNVYTDLSVLLTKPDSYVLYASREFPMFYFFNDEELIKLKIYIWFNLLKVTPVHKRIRYDDFIVTDKINEQAKKVGDLYGKLNVTEVWSIGALINVLMQISYFSKLNQITLSEAEVIVEKIKEAIQKIEEKTFSELIHFNLYQNDIIMNNNAIIVDINGKKIFYYPYTLLKYFIITNQKACVEQENYIREQLMYSTKITRTNIEDHTLFFNDKYQKINDALALLVIDKKRKSIFI